MIEIVFSGRCKDCPHAELEYDVVTLFAGISGIGKIHKLQCKHEEVCDMWEKKGAQDGKDKNRT